MFTRMRLLLEFLYVLSASYGQTLATGTIGRDFYIGILKTFNDQDPQFSLLITTNASGIATIYIPYLGVNTTRSFNQSLEYKVTGDTITKVNTTVERKGIHVTTDVDVTLVVLKYPSYTWEGFLVLPATMLSAKYVISSYDSYADSQLSNFLILSTHDNTHIEIHVNSSIYSVSINHLDTYLFRRYNDLSGVIVKSNKPIAVFSGHEAARVPNTCLYAKYLVEQLLPVKHFAHEFIVPPIPPTSGYIVRVYSSVQNTTVTHSYTTNSKTISLSKAGDFHEIISDNDPMYVMADKPVQVMLYAACYGYKYNFVGDTFMTMIPSITQFTSSYHFTVFSSSDQFTHYLVITSRTEYISGLRINGHELRNLFHTYNVSHANLTFTVNVYNMTIGVYHLQHVQGKPFGAIQYGFYSYYSFGYSLGMNTFKDGKKFSYPVNRSLRAFTLQPKMDCGNLLEPANGQVDISNGTLVGSQAVYSCMSGYALHGEQTRKCLADGYWNGSQPICQPSGGGLTCLDCKDMSHLFLCDTVRACSDGQAEYIQRKSSPAIPLSSPVCYVETYKTNGGQVKYNSGCVDSHQCASWKQQKSKRSAECVHCCTSQLCNANGCGSQGLPPQDLRGPLCYECSYVSNMEECKTVKLCAKDEVCSIEKYDWGGVYDHYTAKCHSMQCISHKRSFNQYVSSTRTSRSTPVCQNCCSSDLCNTKCNMTSSQGGAGVSIVG